MIAVHVIGWESSLGRRCCVPLLYPPRELHGGRAAAHPDALSHNRLCIKSCALRRSVTMPVPPRVLFVTTLICGRAVCDGLALPQPRRWGHLVRERLTEHSALLERARQLQVEEESAEEEATDGGAGPSWRRLLLELRETQQARLVVPASALSLVLCASELLAPRLRGRAFDAVLAPGASLAVLQPHLRGPELQEVVSRRWSHHLLALRRRRLLWPFAAPKALAVAALSAPWARAIGPNTSHH